MRKRSPSFVTSLFALAHPLLSIESGVGAPPIEALLVKPLVDLTPARHGRGAEKLQGRLRLDEAHARTQRTGRRLFNTLDTEPVSSRRACGEQA